MNNDNRLRLSEAKNLFRQALQRQNDRAAGMKMPDDMEQRVMKSLKPQATKRRWLYPISAIAVAANVLLLIMLGIEQKHQPKQLPVIVEEVTEPKNEVQENTLKVVEKDNVDKSQTSHVKLANITREVGQLHTRRLKSSQPTKKSSKAVKVEEPLLAETEPMPEEAETTQEYLPTEPDPFLLAAAFSQDIRSRGEHLYQEVAQMINNQ